VFIDSSSERQAGVICSDVFVMDSIAGRMGCLYCHFMELAFIIPSCMVDKFSESHTLHRAESLRS
jgi:hypothetical protein